MSGIIVLREDANALQQISGRLTQELILLFQRFDFELQLHSWRIPRLVCSQAGYYAGVLCCFEGFYGVE